MHYALSKTPAEHCIIEGMMGFFDGIANSYQNSCFDICRKLQIPSLLVYAPKGEMFSVIPKINGMVEFGQSTIKAVLFNRISEKYFNQLSSAVQEYSDLEVVGYVPTLNQAEFGSRHLGLIQSDEIEDIDHKIDHIADSLSKTVDLNAIESLMASPKPGALPADFSLRQYDVTVAIAKDKAFSFYYRENLELLDACCRVVYFSPLDDKGLPPCDLVYFGGGYPEVFRQELADNYAMLNAVRDFGNKGGFIFGECGGLMYLLDYIEDSKMVGLLSGKCTLTKSLQRFGYIDLMLNRDCFLGPAGTRFTGHEFHKSTAVVDCPTVYNITKTKGDAQWTCGFLRKNIVAGYPHINFLSNIDLLKTMLTFVETSS
jgi:cobyrinic acid a,c-diamide synthase